IYRTSGTPTISGSNNLIRQVVAITTPAGTLTGDPLLGVLGDYGCLAQAGFGGSAIGCPRAVIPGAGSPAINAGANPLALTSDQRGAGYPRIVGAAADIGAIEAGGVAVTTWPINTTVAGSVGGSVLCTPNPVPNGQNASCSATPSAGYVFVAFSGDCTGATCTLTNVTAARNVTATFALAPVANNAQQVPTLPTWLMALLGALLVFCGYIANAKRR
ncbi:MAG: InlB B-repeat-containing protein, partial [Casimicrobium sp.]